MTHRIIYAVRYWLAPLPTDLPGSSTAIRVNLNRDGNADGRNGRPRHKPRTIDLRVGDEIMSSGRWRKIVEIEVDGDSYIDDEKVDACTVGYAYRLKDEKRTAEEIRAASPRPGR